MEKETPENKTGSIKSDTPTDGKKVLNNVDKPVDKSKPVDKPEKKKPEVNKDFVFDGDFNEGMLPTLTEEQKKKTIEWKTNHIKVIKLYCKMLDDNDMIPDPISIANETGLNPATVAKHLREMCFTNYKNTIKPLTYPAILRLAKTAKADSPQSVPATKLLFQIAEDWSEKNTQIIVEVNQIIEIANQMIASMKEVIDSTDFTDKEFTKEKFTIELLRKVESTIEKLSLNINGSNTKT